MSDIPQVRAGQLCAAFRSHFPAQTAAVRLTCWGCTALAPKAFAGRRWARKAGNRGCRLINRAFDAEELQWRRQPVPGETTG